MVVRSLNVYMKVGILILLSFLIFSCNKNGTNEFLMHGKLVVANCQVIVVQVTNPRYFFLTQNTWTSLSGQTYQHVFRVGNYCYFPYPEINREFYFKLKTFPLNTCPICTSFEVPPQVSQTIQFLKYVQ